MLHLSCYLCSGIYQYIHVSSTDSVTVSLVIHSKKMRQESQQQLQYFMQDMTYTIVQSCLRSQIIRKNSIRGIPMQNRGFFTSAVVVFVSTVKKFSIFIKFFTTLILKHFVHFAKRLNFLHIYIPKGFSNLEIT